MSQIKNSISRRAKTGPGGHIEMVCGSKGRIVIALHAALQKKKQRFTVIHGNFPCSSETIMQRRDFMLKTAASLAFGSLTVAGCSTSFNATGAPPAGSSGSASADKRAQIEQGVDATLTRLYSTAPDSRDLVAKANGVLVFPSVIAAGFGIGGEYGEGALRVHGKTEANYSLGAVSFGLQIGAQSKAIIFLFMTPDVLDKFRKSEGWSIGVDASAALIKIGANGKIDANTVNGPLLAFVMTNAGLMANLSLEGTKITRLKL